MAERGRKQKATTPNTPTNPNPNPDPNINTNTEPNPKPNSNTHTKLTANTGINKNTNTQKNIKPNTNTNAKKKRSAYSADSNTPWYYIIPLLFVVAVIPLIVYLKAVPLQGEAFLAWNGQKVNADFFSYYKGIWLEVAAFSALVLILVKGWLDGFRAWPWTYYYIPIVAYALTAILSAVYSRYEAFFKVIEAAGAGREEKATEISDRLQIPGKK